MPRPSLYSPELIEKITNRLSTGEPLAQICREEGMPSVTTVEIYGLHDPVTGELRYVGKANNANKRLKSHLKDSRRRKTPLYSWIRKLAESGLYPEVRVIEVVDASEWEQCERRCIARERQNGRLLNLADGGNAPRCTTAIRSRNARKVNDARALSKDAEQLYHGKKTLTNALRYYIKTGNETRATALRDTMQYCYMTAPTHFAGWKNI